MSCKSLVYREGDLLTVTTVGVLQISQRVCLTVSQFSVYHSGSLPQGFLSTQLLKKGLPLHTSPYLWYWIVVANAKRCIHSLY